MKTMKIRVIFEEPVLGTRPADPEIHAHYIASKAPDAKTMAEEIAAHGAEEVEERGKTIFEKMEDGTPFLYTYMLEGFFKEAARTLKKVPGTITSKTTAYLKKVDNFIFVEGFLKGNRRIMPLYLPMDLDLTATDNQRPLRASTPQGERVALAHSEEAPAGTYFECSITCLIDADVKLVMEWLDYGHWKGMGQWRNSGLGRMVWEELDDLGNVIGGNAKELMHTGA